MSIKQLKPTGAIKNISFHPIIEDRKSQCRLEKIVRTAAPTHDTLLFVGKLSHCSPMESNLSRQFHASMIVCHNVLLTVLSLSLNWKKLNEKEKKKIMANRKFGKWLKCNELLPRRTAVLIPTFRNLFFFTFRTENQPFFNLMTDPDWLHNVADMYETNGLFSTTLDLLFDYLQTPNENLVAAGPLPILQRNLAIRLVA